MRSRLLWVVGAVALVAVLVALSAFAQEKPGKEIRGTVVSTDVEKLNLTVKVEGTDQVLVLVVNWKQVEGKWGRDAAQVEILKTLKPGDKIAAVYFFAEEQNILRSISKVGGEGPAGIGEQLKAMDARLVAMEKKLDNIEAMLKQLLAK